jgi:hypothetical protein
MQQMTNKTVSPASSDNKAPVPALRIELRCEFTPPFVRSTSGRTMDTITWDSPGPVTNTNYRFRVEVLVLVDRRHPDHLKMPLTRDHDISMYV